MKATNSNEEIVYRDASLLRFFGELDSPMALAVDAALSVSLAAALSSDLASSVDR